MANYIVPYFEMGWWKIGMAHVLCNWNFVLLTSPTRPGHWDGVHNIFLCGLLERNWLASKHWSTAREKQPNGMRFIRVNTELLFTDSKPRIYLPFSPSPYSSSKQQWISVGKRYTLAFIKSCSWSQASALHWVPSGCSIMALLVSRMSFC